MAVITAGRGLAGAATIVIGGLHTVVVGMAMRHVGMGRQARNGLRISRTAESSKCLQR